jgi:hypothetical protein
LQYIQRVISKTERPSWLNSVPKNFGEAAAGTLKADEWRILSTVYLPIALITMWGDADDGGTPKHPLRPILDHAMSLFQAVGIAMRYTMTQNLANNYRRLIKQWIDDLRDLFPQYRDQKRTRTNIHIALHVYDFLIRFGPVVHWWSFPFERLIGTIQKITTNDNIGGTFVP